MKDQNVTILQVLKALSRLVFRFWLIVTGAVILFLIIQRLQRGAIADLDFPHFAGISFILLAMSALLRLPATLFRQP